MTQVNSVITGIGGYVPEYILDNKEISQIVDTTEEWILTRVGIRERRILKDPNLGAAYLGEQAARNLFSKREINVDEIDLVICATSTSDHVFPATAAKIAHALGIKNAFAFDVQAACTGFLVALSIANGYIVSGRAKKALVIASEKMSYMTDYQDRQTCPLFGDGAGVVILEPTTENVGIMDFNLHTNGEGVKHLHMKSGGSVSPASHETIERREHYVYQEGSAVFKNAVSDMSQVSADIMERNNLTGDDINWLVPHQANLRIIDATVKRTNVSYDRVMINIQKYGNTSSASIPLCLWDYEAKLKKGDNLILTAFGAGFTWGAVYLKWGY